ncbi:MAG: hypothetical protein ACRDRX_02630 [Pseudonocardiaceae bacterium]
MTSLDAGVTQLVHARLEVALARMAAAVRPPLSEFDLLRGLTGLGAYLLHRDPHGDLVRQSCLAARISRVPRSSPSSRR